MSISPSLLWFMAGSIAGIILTVLALWAGFTLLIYHADRANRREDVNERR